MYTDVSFNLDDITPTGDSILSLYLLYNCAILATFPIKNVQVTEKMKRTIKGFMMSNSISLYGFE